jgi:hypothetical protein
MSETTRKLEVSDLFQIFFIKSYLPEMADLIGAEATVKVISVFGGMEMNIPSRAQFLKTCRNICIYIAMNNDVSAKRLGEQYKMTPQRVYQIYRETKLQIDAYYSLKEKGQDRKRIFDPDIPDNDAECARKAVDGQEASIEVDDEE